MKNNHKNDQVNGNRAFIDMVNHELKSPLVTIKISTEILQREFKSEKKTSITQTLQKIDSKVNYLTQLINDYTDLVKFKSRQLKFHPKLYSIDNLVFDLMDKFPQVKFFKSSDFHQNIFIDFDRFTQILTGLINYLPKVVPLDSSYGLSITNSKNKIYFYLYGLLEIPPKNFNFSQNSDWLEITPDRINTLLATEFFKSANGSFRNFYHPKLGTIFCFNLPSFI